MPRDAPCQRPPTGLALTAPLNREEGRESSRRRRCAIFCRAACLRYREDGRGAPRRQRLPEAAAAGLLIAGRGDDIRAAAPMLSAWRRRRADAIRRARIMRAGTMISNMYFSAAHDDGQPAADEHVTPPKVSPGWPQRAFMPPIYGLIARSTS